MAKKIKVDKYNYHEALDRLNVIISNLNDHVLEHPVSKKHKKIRKKIEKALDKLSEVYQDVGNIEFEIKE